jgi:hypothetical protein
MHQELMNSAYDKYADELSHEAWMKILTPLEQKAVVLGNLNYQVENGGFVQWVDNGYYLDSPLVIECLKEIGTELALRVLAMVEDVLSETNPHATREGFGGKYWLCELEDRSRPYWFNDDDEDNDGYEEPTHSSFSNHDEEYYKINEQLMVEMEEYLTKLANNA